MELIPIIDPKSSPISVKGLAERKWAERNNLTHLTTLIIPVGADRRVHVQVRHPEKTTYRGCRDFFGGHVTATGELLGCLLRGKFDPEELEEIVKQAAVREANEELRLHTEAARLPVDINASGLVQVGGLGDFPCEIEGNRERSTLFLFPIPQDCVLAPMDDTDGKFFSVETEFFTFDEVKKQYALHPQNTAAALSADYETNKRDWQFADGAGRILDDPTLTTRVLNAINALAANLFRQASGAEQSRPV